MWGQINFLTLVFLEMKLTKLYGQLESWPKKCSTDLLFCFLKGWDHILQLIVLQQLLTVLWLKIKMKPCTKSSHCHLPAPLTSLRALFNHQFSSVQSLSRVWLFATPWIVARQAPCPSPTPRTHSNSRPSYSCSNYQSLDSFIFPFALPMADYISFFQSQF